jgi:hypothetical protein
MKKYWIVGIVLIALIVGLFFIRLISSSQVDDVNPLMNCSEEILDLADVYFIVPKFEGVNISGEWCNKILAKDKELAIHGVYHTYKEFGIFRDEEYVGVGIEIFRDCFGFVPEKFKPGHLRWSGENDWIKDSMDVELLWNQVFHKVYHCGDAGLFPNWIIRIF